MNKNINNYSDEYRIDYEIEIKRAKRRKKLLEERRKKQQRIRKIKRIAASAAAIIVLSTAGVASIYMSKDTAQTESSYSPKETLEVAADINSASNISKNLYPAISPVYSEIDSEDIKSPYIALLDVENNSLIAGRNSDQMIYPASMTKVINLYVLSTEVVENGKVVDKEETRIGIRHIEMSIEKGFVINGKPLRLVGSNRHMEYPYVGNAISDQAQYRDMYQIRSNGFNIVRLGHYPQATAALDACDELGLLAIEPIPGWQFFNKNPLFISLTHRDVRDMIRRDRNHPSIVMWETTLNESWPPAEWKDGVVKIAHEELPGDQCFTSGDSYGYKGFDVCYNDWEEGFKRPNNSGKPGFIREYYDYEFGGHYSTTRIRRGDGEKAQLQNAWNAQW